MQSLSSHTLPVELFAKEIQRTSTVSGTAFFLTPDPEGIPFVLQHQWLRTHIVYDTIVLLTVVTESRPFVAPSHRVDITQLTERLYRVKAHYGFMQQPKIDQILEASKRVRPDLDLSKPTYFLASPKISRDKSRDALWSWQWSLYRWMIRNARPLTDSLGLPANRTVEFGVDVPL